MAHIPLDTNLPDCPEVVELEEILGVDEAWRFLFYLWSWALESDFQTGVVKLTPGILCRAARWSGDKQMFFDALRTPVGPRNDPWLIDQGNGYYYLRGWSRNVRFFVKKERGRERQRLYRERLDKQHEEEHDAKCNALRDALHNANGDDNVTHNVDPDHTPSRSPPPPPPPPPSPPPSPPQSIVTVTGVNQHVSSSTQCGMEAAENQQSEEPANSTDASPDGEMARAELTAAINAVIEHYRTYHTRARPGNRERRKIRDRIREGYSVEDLCKAIDGCHKTPHNLGENERGQTYLSLELIVRNADQVNRFCEYDDSPPKSSAHKATEPKPPYLKYFDELPDDE